jgi:hypothetical protein
MGLVKRMIEVILADAEAAFRPISPVTFKIDRLETNPRFAAISRPNKRRHPGALPHRHGRSAAARSRCCCPMRRWSRSAIA